MSPEEKHEAALSDPDALPQTPERLARMKRTPQVKIIRRALGLSQRGVRGLLSYPARHAARLGAGPLSAGRAGRAYMRVIARQPGMVRDALAQDSARTAAE